MREKPFRDVFGKNIPQKLPLIGKIFKNHKLLLEILRLPQELKTGIAQIQALYPHRFRKSKQARKVVFIKDAEGEFGIARVEKTDKKITVHYKNPSDAYRALGRILGERSSLDFAKNFEEIARMKTIGVMLDVSRNAVVQTETLKQLICRFALMGVNTLILYTEDTYKVKGEPFFGYLRGGYTQKELKELDAYAFRLGIEMFPCIQTLAHFEQVLQWPCYSHLKDVDAVIIAEEEQTYCFLEKIIRNASAPFKSKRIHIGMDEAHGIGTGHYLKKNGYKSPFQILNQHLKKVRDICENLDLKPMIWSDMYFRLGSKTEDYYDRESVIPPEVMDQIPAAVELVYWDYYHTDASFYEEWIDRHRALNCEPIMAGGVWTWSHFWSALPFSFAATEACMTACKNKKLKEVFVTLWGDDGMECDLFSALPGIQYFSDQAYSETPDMEQVISNFRGTCEGTFKSWYRASDLDSIEEILFPQKSNTNISKWLLWDDPLLGIAQPHLPQKSLMSHYTRLAKDLTNGINQLPGDHRLRFPAQLARVLALKSDLHSKLVSAYKSKNKKELRKIQMNDLVPCQKEVKILWLLHRELWLTLYKPFGLEVIEQRYGGLMARLESLSRRLDDFLSQKDDQILELEAQRYPFMKSSADYSEGDFPRMTYARVSTSSRIR
ncbi:MAG: beta-N-acetylhexosaminidase [Verrucomicrobiota bacterium]